VASPDGSSIGAAPVAQVLPRFLDEPIKAAGIDVGFELSVPFLSVKLSKPGAKRDSLFVGQAPDGFFELLYRVHVLGLQHARRRKSRSKKVRIAIALAVSGIFTLQNQAVKDIARVFAPRPFLLAVEILSTSSAFLITVSAGIGSKQWRRPGVLKTIDVLARRTVPKKLSCPA
jgi:hypothetical protein